jgi:hypothetical protein
MGPMLRNIALSAGTADSVRLGLVIPSEPPVADYVSPQRREHRCGTDPLHDGRVRAGPEALVDLVGEL